MKFLSVIIWLDSTDIPVINCQVRFLWSSASFKIEDKHECSLFHDFSDEFLPNHSYVTYTDVHSLNHMNTKYLKHVWITNATADHLAPRTMISFRKWSFWSYKNLTNSIITIPIFLQRWFWNTSERIQYHGNKYRNNMFRPLRWTSSRNAQVRFGWDLRNVLMYCVDDIRICGNLQFRENLRSSLLQFISLRTSIFFNCQYLSCFQNWLN